MQRNLDVSSKIYFAYTAICADFFSVIDLSRKTTAFGSLGFCDYALFELEFPIHYFECHPPPPPPMQLHKGFSSRLHFNERLSQVSCHFHLSPSLFIDLRGISVLQVSFVLITKLCAATDRHISLRITGDSEDNPRVSFPTH